MSLKWTFALNCGLKNNKESYSVRPVNFLAFQWHIICYMYLLFTLYFCTLYKI